MARQDSSVMKPRLEHVGWNPHKRLLTIAEAARSIGRPRGTLDRWVHEGRLKPHASQGRTSLYLEADVLDAEHTTRGVQANDNRVVRVRRSSHHLGDSYPGASPA